MKTVNWSWSDDNAHESPVLIAPNQQYAGWVDFGMLLVHPPTGCTQRKAGAGYGPGQRPNAGWSFSGPVPGDYDDWQIRDEVDTARRLLGMSQLPESSWYHDD